MAESFFAQFKRSVDGTFHNVSRQHLSRYADEFAFRWNTSKMTDAQRVQTLIDNTPGRRLTYRPLPRGTMKSQVKMVAKLALTCYNRWN